MASRLAGGLLLDAEIRHAEVSLQQSTYRLRNHLARGRVQAGAKFQSLKPKVLVGVAAAAVGWLLVGARRPRVMAPPQTAPTVRLHSYAGRWFELARLSNPFEAVCDHNVTATYVPRPDGRFDVINRCETRRGRLRQAQGIARVVSGSADAKLKVSFAPRALRWMPFAWADYWILDVTPDYSAALVGTPGRNALWLLGRSPTIEQGTLERLLARAAALGYDIAALKFTPQTGREPGITRP